MECMDFFASSVSVVGDSDDSLRPVAELGVGHDQGDDNQQGDERQHDGVDRQRFRKHVVRVLGTER